MRMHFKLLTLVILVTTIEISAGPNNEEKESIKGCESTNERMFSGSDETVGKPLSLFTEKNGELTLDEKNLTKLLCRKDVKDNHVAVISIAGAFRMGKSFTMNLFLQYFQKNLEKGWLSEYQNSSLNKGISWRGGSKRHTVGITAWSKPFIVEKDGSKMAVILLDTQGNFDHESTKERSIRIFALSTLFSSLQIFNVMKQIQANDLEHLQTFVEYSKFPYHVGGYSDDQRKKFEKIKPFQDLLFLVRDWANLNDYAHGREGGNEYFKNLELEFGNSGRVSVQDYLYNAFTKINCYLMPEPPEKVRITKTSDQSLVVKDLGDDFATHIENLANDFIHPLKLANKIISSEEKMNGNELFKHVKHCAKVLLSGDGPVIGNEVEMIAKYDLYLQSEKMIKNYEQNVMKSLESAQSWQDYDDILKRSQEETKHNFTRAAWFGKGTEVDTDAMLKNKFEEKDMLLKEVMRKKRETIAERNIKAWREKYIKILEERNYFYTSATTLDTRYNEAVRNIFKENDRDPTSIKNMIEAAKNAMRKFYETVKKHLKDENKLKKAAATIFACGVSLYATPLLVGASVSAAGVSMLYSYWGE